MEESDKQFNSQIKTILRKKSIKNDIVKGLYVEATRNGFQRSLKTLLTKKKNVLDEQFRIKLILMAIESGNIQIFRSFHQRGVININEKLFSDTSSNTALHLAIKHNNAKLVEYLIENRSDVRIYNDMGFSSLEWALKISSFEALKVLADNGVPLDVWNPEKDVNPLFLALKESNDDCLIYLTSKLILSYEFSIISEYYENGINTLLYASSCGRLKFIQFVLMHCTLRESNQSTMKEELLRKDPIPLDCHKYSYRYKIIKSANLLYNQQMENFEIARKELFNTIYQIPSLCESYINYKDPHGGDALSHASNSNHLEIMMLLYIFKKNSNINFSEILHNSVYKLNTKEEYERCCMNLEFWASKNANLKSKFNLNSLFYDVYSRITPKELIDDDNNNNNYNNENNNVEEVKRCDYYERLALYILKNFDIELLDFEALESINIALSRNHFLQKMIRIKLIENCKYDPIPKNDWNYDRGDDIKNWKNVFSSMIDAIQIVK